MALTGVGASLTGPSNVLEGTSIRTSENDRTNLNLSSSSTLGSPFRPNIGVSSRSTRHIKVRRRSSTIEAVSVSDVAANPAVSDNDLPLKEIPGSYGLPFFGAIKDRLDFMWFQTPPKFYEARRDEYQSTVFRTNVPPGPPFFPDPRVIALLDEKSYPILFDVSKVEKKDIFVGTYVPSLDLTGGYRVLSYLDPSEPKHALLKRFAFEILKNSGPRIVPELQAAVADMFGAFETAVKKDGKVSFGNGIQQGSFRMVLKIYTKQDPYVSAPNSLGEAASNETFQWLLSQIAPISPIPVPWFLAPAVELFLHTLRVPAVLTKGTYTKLVNFFREYGTDLLDIAEKEIGLDREEALVNLVFLTCFNTWGGFNIFFPLILKYLGGTSPGYQRELATEVRNAVSNNGGQLSPRALADMPLVISAVYEVLRIDPPVPFQYAKAKEDLIIESHDAKFRIKKGEILAGYLGVTCKDPKVFKDATTFVPKRFVSDEGKALLKYVLWSNGPQTEEPTELNKHCAGKDFVLLVAQLFVASIYLKYDRMVVDAAGTDLVALKPNAAIV